MLDIADILNIVCCRQIDKQTKRNNRSHRASKLHMCNLCNLTFKIVAYLQFHKRVIHEDKRKCVYDECDKCFGLKSYVESHYQSVTFACVEHKCVCDRCGTKLKTKKFYCERISTDYIRK